MSHAAALTDAILAADLVAVAELLDQNTPIEEPSLMALIKMAWEHRGAKEDLDLVDAAENARQIYTLMSEAGADLKFQTNRGRIVDRIAAIQPEWPTAADLATDTPQVTHVAGRSLEEQASPEFPTPRPARGAMHRRPR